MTAYKTKVWTGTEWAEIATSVTNLDGYWAKSEYPGRNLLYNGAMQVHQRGTSASGITGAGYNTADRWRTDISSLGTWTQTIEADGPTGSGITKSLKTLMTSAAPTLAAGSYAAIHQNLEGQDLQRIAKGSSSAQPLTMSFWVKSNKTGTYTIWLYDNTNARSVSASYTISSSGVWEKKTVIIPADTVGTIVNDNSGALWVYFFLSAGSNRTSGTLQTTWGADVVANRAVGQVNLSDTTNNYFQITGVQLETGYTATPFEFEPYETTLRKCQRYYVRFTKGTNFGPTLANGHISGTVALYVIKMPVSMRSSPNMTISGTWRCASGASSSDVTAFAGGDGGIDFSRIYFTVSGLTSGYATHLDAISTGAYIDFNAEL